jgi:hypothetical protein
MEDAAALVEVVRRPAVVCREDGDSTLCLNEFGERAKLNVNSQRLKVFDLSI